MPILASLRANIAATVLGAIAAILLCIAVVQTVQIHGFLWIDGLEDKLADCARDRNELRGELDRISAARNEQADRTKSNIAQGKAGRDRAEVIAKRIEDAPVEPGCRTPKAIMESDI